LNARAGRHRESRQKLGSFSTDFKIPFTMPPRATSIQRRGVTRANAEKHANHTRLRGIGSDMPEGWIFSYLTGLQIHFEQAPEMPD